MTFEEICALKNRAAIQLADGSIGHIVVWHRGSGMVAIEVPGRPGVYNLPCSRMQRDRESGIVVEVATKVAA